MTTRDTSALLVVDMQNDFLAKGGYYDEKAKRTRARQGKLSAADIEALVQAGAAVELHMLSGLPHGFARRPGFVERLQDEIAFFFKRTVVNPQAYAEALAAPLVAG